MPSRKDAFLLNLWVEAAGGGEPARWRGSIEHLATRRRYYFTVLAELVRFLGHHIVDASPREDAEVD
jgi:hypothetical protein